MEGNTRSAELQKTAKDFLHGALYPHRANVDDIAQEVINLLLGDDANPLTDLIKARYHLTSPPNVPTIPKPQSSKLSFRFSRNRNKDRQLPKAVDSGSKPSSSSSSRFERCQQEFQSVFQADVAFATDKGNSPAQQLQPSNSLGKQAAFHVTPRSPEHSKALAAAPSTYSCCFCHTSYSVKGTCKRHLEEIHVAKKYYECEKCRHVSPTVPEAKKHANACSVGVLGWTTVKPPNRQVYSSGFTNQLFSTQQRYIDHLLELSALPKDQRPRMSYHMKLRNLLGQRMFEAAIHRLSSRLFEDPEAWREVRWEHKRIHAAVGELEYGKLEHDLDAHDMLGLHRVKTFLDELFSDRLALPEAIGKKPEYVASPYDKDGQPSTTALPGLYIGSAVAAQDSAVGSSSQMTTVSREPSSVQSRYFGNQAAMPKAIETEPTGKRPLSYETAMRVPDRQPPGPPSGGLSVPSQAGIIVAEAQPSALSSHNFMDSTSYGMPTPAWSFPEQPPPYDTRLGTHLHYQDLSESHQNVGPMVHDTLHYANQHSMDFVGSEDFTTYIPQDSGMLDLYTPSAQFDYDPATNIQLREHLGPHPAVALAAPHDVSGDFHTWYDAPDAGHGDSLPGPGTSDNRP
ncbi:hypothetical protein LTR85_000713 [Meristemomyces frigidus]|nr:hypothetical protein LTR85_000713 [Meristemomyces frigidus]